MSLADQIAKSHHFISYDSSLKEIRINFNDVHITIEGDGISWELQFKNFIAFEFHGMWDENILGGIEVNDSSSLIESAKKAILERYGPTPDASLQDRQFQKDWFHYTLHLIDGCDIQVVADDLEVNER